MLVDDFLVSDAAPSPRQWLRQSMDLMTLLVMLRATLLTRMTGDSGPPAADRLRAGRRNGPRRACDFDVAVRAGLPA